MARVDEDCAAQSRSSRGPMATPSIAILNRQIGDAPIGRRRAGHAPAACRRGVVGHAQEEHPVARTVRGRSAINDVVVAINRDAIRIGQDRQHRTQIDGAIRDAEVYCRCPTIVIGLVQCLPQ